MLPILHFLLCMQLMKLAIRVLMEMFVWLVEAANMRVDWKYVLMTNGEQYVKLDGVLLILQQCVSSLDIPIPEVNNGL